MLHNIAEVNHYAVRSLEEFTHKKGRPAASNFADRYTDTFHRRTDRNEIENLSAVSYGARFDREYQRLCQIPGAMRLHHLCCADYVADMCAGRGEDPKLDYRYRKHMDLAKSLPRH